MTKMLNSEDFTKRLDLELTWRRREISDLKRAIKDAPVVSQASLLRAFVPVLYAHWEGFSVRACQTFFKYITDRKISIGRLSPHYGNLIFMKRLSFMLSSKSSFDDRIRVIAEIRSEADVRFSKLPEELIETGSNLNSARMRSLCLLCGIDAAFIDGAEDLIDVQMLKRRNEIAHGEWSTISSDEVEKLSDGVFDLLTTFRNQLEAVIWGENYKKQGICA
jgi:hypothetical protein